MENAQKLIKTVIVDKNNNNLLCSYQKRVYPYKKITKNQNSYFFLPNHGICDNTSRKSIKTRKKCVVVVFSYDWKFKIAIKNSILDRFPKKFVVLKYYLIPKRMIWKNWPSWKKQQQPGENAFSSISSKLYIAGKKFLHQWICRQKTFLLMYHTSLYVQ